MNHFTSKNNTVLTTTLFAVIEKVPWVEGGNRVLSFHESLDEAKKEASELNSKVMSGLGFFAAEGTYNLYGTVHLPPSVRGTPIKVY